MKKILLVIAASLGLSLAETARADGLALGLKIGTLGPGVEAAAFVTSNLNLRAAGNYIAFNYKVGVDDINYNGNLRLSTLLGLVDLHPFGGGFRLSGGVVINDSKIDLTGKPANDTVKIGGTTYPSASVGQINGQATFDHIAPYAGIGYGAPVNDGTDFSFSFDLGVIIQSSPQISLSATGAAASDPTFRSDLNKERDRAQNVADKFRLYPVLSFGICYQFW